MRYFSSLPGEGPGKDSGDASGEHTDGGASNASVEADQVHEYSGRPAWFGPPDDEVPVSIPLQRVLVRTPGAVMTLCRCDVYRTGLEFALRVDLRFDQIEGWQPEPPQQGLFLLDHGPRHPRMRLHLGVRFSDGTEAQANSRFDASPFGDSPFEDPAGPILIAQAGGGGGGPDNWSTTMNLWLFPLPPEGELVLSYACEDAGISEGTVVLNATELRSRVEDVIGVWDAPVD